MSSVLRAKRHADPHDPRRRKRNANGTVFDRLSQTASSTTSSSRSLIMRLINDRTKTGDGVTMAAAAEAHHQAHLPPQQQDGLSPVVIDAPRIVGALADASLDCTWSEFDSCIEAVAEDLLQAPPSRRRARVHRHDDSSVTPSKGPALRAWAAQRQQHPSPPALQELTAGGGDGSPEPVDLGRGEARRRFDGGDDDDVEDDDMPLPRAEAPSVSPPAANQRRLLDDDATTPMAATAVEDDGEVSDSTTSTSRTESSSSSGGDGDELPSPPVMALLDDDRSSTPTHHAADTFGGVAPLPPPPPPLPLPEAVPSSSPTSDGATSTSDHSDDDGNAAVALLASAPVRATTLLGRVHPAMLSSRERHEQRRLARQQQASKKRDKDMKQTVTLQRWAATVPFEVVVVGQGSRSDDLSTSSPGRRDTSVGGGTRRTPRPVQLPVLASTRRGLVQHVADAAIRDFVRAAVEDRCRRHVERCAASSPSEDCDDEATAAATVTTPSIE